MKWILWSLLICLAVFLGWYVMLFNRNVKQPLVDPHDRRAMLQSVTSLYSWNYNGVVSGMLMLWELHPRITWFFMLSWSRSLNLSDHVEIAFNGFINTQQCNITYQSLSSWDVITFDFCSNIRNINDWKLLSYLQDKINQNHIWFITGWHKNFTFLLYPWKLLNNMTNVISSEEWKCNSITCSFFIDKDLMRMSWSIIPPFITHKASLDMWSDNKLEIRNRSIDSGNMNGYIWSQTFELLYERWWIFKKLIQTKWFINNSGYSLSLDIGSALHWKAVLENAWWHTMRGLLMSSGGTVIRIW